MADEYSERQNLNPNPEDIGTGRFNGRPPVDISPVDTGWDPIRESNTPTRRPRMPIALESLGQYQEWCDDSSGRKSEVSAIALGGADHPQAPSEYRGDWQAFDPMTGYRLTGVG